MKGDIQAMTHADQALANRLESLICVEFRRLAEVAQVALPHVRAEHYEVADGVALWLGEGSPVNQAVGLAMTRSVETGEVAGLEAFYHQRGAPASASLCPLADRSLLEIFGRRGWRASEFEHLLVLELEEGWFRGPLDSRPGESMAGDPGDLEVRVCLPAERETCGRIAALGLSGGDPPGPSHEEFGRIMAAREEAVLVLAWVDGEPAGTGGLVIEDEVGWLSGDSTLSQYRRRGIQRAIQLYRLRLACEAGCRLAVTEATPGSASQRNMERLGFRIAYTHVEFVKD